MGREEGVRNPTKRQLQALKYIAAHKLRTRTPPTIQHVANSLSVHRGSAYEIIVCLRRHGLIDTNNSLTDKGRTRLPARCPHCRKEIYVENMGHTMGSDAAG